MVMLLLLPRRFFSLPGDGEAGGKATATRRLVSATLNQASSSMGNKPSGRRLK